MKDGSGLVILGAAALALYLLTKHTAPATPPAPSGAPEPHVLQDTHGNVFTIHTDSPAIQAWRQDPTNPYRGSV